MLAADVTLYPEQPMVVDISLSGDAPLPDDLVLSHETDAGLVIAELDEAPRGTRAFRVRGLAPATDHVMTATAGEVSTPIAFTAHDPLPGFIPAFDTLGTSTGERPWRMFDLNPFPDFATSSLFMVDGSGQTRFHMGRALGAEPGAESVLAAAKLRDDGTILFVAEHALQIIDEFGHEVLRIEDETLGLTGLHHDVLELDSGNFVALSNSFEVVNYPGFGPTLTAGDVLVEFTPQGEVVWQWDTFTDLDPLRITEAIDTSTPLVHPETGEDTYDWTHANGVTLSPDGSSFLISLRHQDWMVSVNRASQDVEWRLGPGGDFALTSGRWFYHPHSPQWQDDGSLLLYDNGVGRPDGSEVARVARFALDFETLEAAEVWEDDEQTFAAPIAGDCDVLPRSDRILVTDSAIFTALGPIPRVREVDPTADPMTVWQLLLPTDHFAYRTTANDRIVGPAR